MIVNKRDITLVLVLFIITIFCVRYFHKKMSDDQLVASIEPLSLVLPTPKAILSVNRPEVLHKMILPIHNFKTVFQQYTPTIFTHLIEKGLTPSTCVFAYYPEGVLMIATMSQQNSREIYDQLDSFFTYPFLEKTKYRTTFQYYPDINKQFLGCFYKNGLFVASYANRLLKETAKKLQLKDNQMLPEIQKAIRQKGKSAAMNIYYPSQTVNLYVQTSDTTEWKIEEQWLSSDLFFHEGKVCCVNELKYEQDLDSLQLYHNLSDTIQLRMNQLFPQIKTTTQVSHDEAVAYFTICGE